MFNFRKAKTEAVQAVQATQPAPQPQPVKEPTKLERLMEKRQAEIERERQAKADYEATVKETERLKAEYQAKVNEARAEKSKLEAIAKEIRLAIVAAEEATKRAQNARDNYEDLAVDYADSLVDMHNRNESLADSLLEEFGC